MQHNLRSWIFLCLIVGSLMNTIDYNYDDNTWEIESFVVNTQKDFEKLSTLSEESSIHFKWPTMATMNSGIFEILSDLSDLKVDRGKVLTIEIVPQLEHVQLDNCQTNSIIINPAHAYKLQSLIVWKTPLATIPNHIIALKELTHLDLSDNQIEYIDLKQLSDMLKLSSLHLNSNKIKKLTSSHQTTINLPSLELLYLFDNQLTNISFENWNSTSLRHLHLHRNGIPIAKSLLSAFPALKDVRIHDNPLYCTWKNFVVEELLARNVKLFKANDIKCLNKGEMESNVEELSYKMWKNTNKLWKKTDSQMKEMQKSFQNSNYKIFEEIQKARSSMNASIQTLNQTIVQNALILQKLDANITQLYHKNDDLTESFYQFTLEHSDEHSTTAVETPIKQENNVDPNSRWHKQQSQLDQFGKTLQKIVSKQDTLYENLRKISLLGVLMANVSNEN